jgi:hypothetical protein
MKIRKDKKTRLKSFTFLFVLCSENVFDRDVKSHKNIKGDNVAIIARSGCVCSFYCFFETNISNRLRLSQPISHAKVGLIYAGKILMK